VIWLEGVAFQRDGRVVLDAVTLGVASSELIVIEGSVASGKTTLLEIAAAARMPDAGTVWFSGRNIATLQRASLPFVRRNIGYCTANPRLIPEDSVLANVMLALVVRGEKPSKAETFAKSALELVKAGDLANRIVASLSLGQKRLVALARAVVGPPPLVVADEPAAGVGDEARTTVIRALTAARGLGAAVLCATADTVLADGLVLAGARKIHIAQGRIAGAPAIGLVPALTSRPLLDGDQQTRNVVGLETNDDDPDGDSRLSSTAAKDPV
jgi:cell division transport system ATP-binding protein